jgi:exopolysaccharide biosynthesis polyprenyl glycosylphosphotransferase
MLLLGLPRYGLGRSSSALKRGFDIAVAGIGLLALMPLLVMIAISIKATSRGPILFKQRRIGRGGNEFEMLKFRSMCVDAEDLKDDLRDHNEAGAGLFKIDADPRITRVGEVLRRLSLDELPQLWNVVRGDMSLVGPRPERVHYVRQFEDAVYRYPDRHRVKSGLTGWAQIHGLRGQTSLADRVEWDNYYIEHWSPWLDVRILLRTFPALFVRPSNDS